MFPSQKGDIEKTDIDYDNEPNHNYGKSSTRVGGREERGSREEGGAGKARARRRWEGEIEL